MASRLQVTRTREAIRHRGLLLHDAFLKFDYSRTGMLSLEEVYGAFEWLKIPVTPEEVLFFVRSVRRHHPRTSYPTSPPTLPHRPPSPKPLP